MTHYFIIGGDGKEYGPITAAELRQWFEEGRLNAQTRTRTETDTAWRPLAEFPEFADLLTAPPSAGAPPPASADEVTSDDYELDIGNCVNRGWNLFKENLGTLWGGFLLAMLVVGALAGLNGAVAAQIPKPLFNAPAFRISYDIGVQAVMALVNGPLFGGVFYLFIRRIRGYPAAAGDVFTGFQTAFKDLFLGSFVVSFLIGLCMLPFKILYLETVQPVLEHVQRGSSSEMHQLLPALLGVLPVLGFCLIPTIYLTVNWQFTLPLIVDKRLDFWSAMKTSWKQVHRHWWLVFGLVVVIGLINVAGVLACCVGELFTAPLTIAATMYAYETLFGRSQTA